MKSDREYKVNKFFNKEFYTATLKLCLVSAAAFLACAAFTIQFGYKEDLYAHDLMYQVEYLYQKKFGDIECDISDKNYVICMNAKRANDIMGSGFLFSELLMKIFVVVFFVSLAISVVSYMGTSFNVGSQDDQVP